MNWFWRFICWRFGHRRGKLIGELDGPTELRLKSYQCPRCGLVRTRKVKVKA